MPSASVLNRNRKYFKPETDEYLQMKYIYVLLMIMTNTTLGDYNSYNLSFDKTKASSDSRSDLYSFIV